MPDIKFRLKRQDPRDKKNSEAHWEEYTVHYEGENLTVLEGLFHIQERFDGKSHSDDQEKDVAETWARIERCGSGPIALEDLFEDDKEDSIKVFVSLLFLARSGKISLWQDELPYGQIYLEIKLPWEIAQLVDGTQAEAMAIQAKMVM